MRKKATVAGAGNVGASCRLADKGLADVVAADVLEGTLTETELAALHKRAVVKG